MAMRCACPSLSLPPRSASSRKNLHHFLSESDYLKQFEDELDMMETEEADEFLKEFEQEISSDDAAFAAELSDNPADAFLDSVNETVTKAKEDAASNLENFSFDLSEEEEPAEEIEEEVSEETSEEISLEPELEIAQEESSEDDILSGVQDILSGGDTADDSAEEMTTDSVDESEEASEESLIGEDFLQPEYSEDALDAEESDIPDIQEIPLEDLATEEGAIPEEGSEIPEITDASVQEVPLMDESGDDVDLMDMLGDSGDLMDIGDLLSADENFEELDEARDEFEAAANEAVEEGTSMEEAEGEEGASAGGIGAIIGKVLGVVQGLLKKKGDDAEEDGTVEIGENAPTMEELAAEDADILSSFSDEETPVEEDPKEKKKREKEEKKKQKQAEKEAKKKEKEAAKAAKPPKEKKEKKPKEPDNSPVIPMKGILPILILGLSVVVLIMVGSNTIQRSLTVKEAKTLYENGNYSESYSKLYPLEDDLDEDELELLHKARILAKLELNLKEYNLAMSQEEYGEALDALLLGTYSYVRNQYDADRLHINDQFNQLGTQIETTLSQQFGVTEEDALKIVQLPKRKDYTKKIHEILRSVNLE